MEQRTMNSFGTITIPKWVREKMKLDGNVSLWMGLRDLPNGEYEIFFRQSNDAEETLAKYKRWAEVIARISECSVALVWNNWILSMSNSTDTEEFIRKNLTVNPELSLSFKKIQSGGATFADSKDKKPTLVAGMDTGQVLAFFKLYNTGDDRCFFVVIQGTKYGDKKITKAEEERRFAIINDILEKI